MKAAEQNLVELFKGITEVLPISVIIADRNKEIKYFNAKANKFLGLPQGISSLFEIFPPQEHSKVNRIFDECARGTVSIKEMLNVKDSAGKVVKCEAILRETKTDDGSSFFVLSINTHLYQTSETLPVQITVHKDDLEKIIRNQRIIQIIDDIRSNYPFTFIGKNKLQQEANKLDELLWLKDSNDNYVLVNKRFADALGQRTGQLEGRSEKNFLPLYFMDFYKSLDNYLRDTLNCVIIEGIPYRGFTPWQSNQTIEIPLYDSENNVLAVIGITQKIAKQIVQPEGGVGESGYFEKMTLPAAAFNEDGVLISGSMGFFSLFKDAVLQSSRLADIFNEEEFDKVQQLLNSDQSGTRFEVEKTLKNDESLVYSCDLQKRFFDENENPGLVVTFEKSLSYDSFEELLKQKGTMYDTLIQLNPEPIFIYDSENLRFLEVNEAALLLYGYKREEFLKMDLTDLYSPEDIQSLLESGPSNERVPVFQGPFRHKKKDGSTVLVQIAKSAFQFENREAHFNIVQPAVESRQSDPKVQFYKSLYEHTSDLMVITDSTGFIQEANQPVVDKFGLPLERILNSSVVEFVEDADRSKLNTSIFFSGIEKPITVPLTFKSAGGQTFKADAIAVPIIDRAQDLEMYQLIIKPHPVEIIREVEKEVIKEVYLEGQADEGARPSVAAGHSGIDAKQIGTIFHEVLTPINVILGFVQELRDSIDTPTQEQIEAGEYINQNRENMLDIMNSISEYAQLSDKSEELIPAELRLVDLVEEVQRDEDLFDSLKKKLEVGKLSSSLTVYSDEKRMKMLLTSLSRICLRITDESQLYLSASQSDEFYFVLSFRDNFSKISDKLLNNFQSFLNGTNQISPKNFQLSRYSFATLRLLLELLKGKVEVIQRSGKTYELGIVLPLNLFQEGTEAFVRSEVTESELQLEPTSIGRSDEHEAFTPVTAAHTPVRASGGAAEVQRRNEEEFEIPESAKFSFQSDVTEAPPQQVVSKYQTFEYTEAFAEAEKTHHHPIPEPPAAPPPQVTSPPTGGSLKLSDLHCLYIEDQVDSQILFKVQMKEMKQIKFAVSFEEALPLLNAHKFDLIVMDINLQGEYNGLDAFKMIKQMPGFEHLPIIAVTAYVLPGDKEKFILAGFNEFITKPIFREKIIDALEKIFMKKIVV